jgi:hypothetical protein
MHATTRRTRFALRSVAVTTCALASLAWTLQASALTTVGSGAFSASATKITFEDLPGDNSDIPAGYASSSGIASFQGATESEVYADYGAVLPVNATAAGLGAVGATWGCDATCGTGFTLSAPKGRVGMFLSSNSPMTVQVSAYRSGVLLGSQTFNFPADQIGFVGFEDAGGIDRIAIGENTADPGSINQLDNILLENLSGQGAAPATDIPTLSQWGMILLCAALVLTTAFALRRR